MTNEQQAADGDLWLEFLVPVKKGTARTICGLCGNHGKLRIGGIDTPAGCRLEFYEAFCICPNGRAMKGHTDAPPADSPRPLSAIPAPAYIVHCDDELKRQLEVARQEIWRLNVADDPTVSPVEDGSLDQAGRVIDNSGEPKK